MQSVCTYHICYQTNNKGWNILLALQMKYFSTMKIYLFFLDNKGQFFYERTFYFKAICLLIRQKWTSVKWSVWTL